MKELDDDVDEVVLRPLVLEGGVGAKLASGDFWEFGLFSLNLFLLPLLLDFFAGADGPEKDEEEEEEVTEEIVTEEDPSPVGWKLAKFGASPVLGA